MKRFLGMVIALLGVASLVLGIIFITQANAAKQTVADEVAPIALADLDAKYDTVSGYFDTYKAAEEPKIQAGQAAPSPTYDYFAAQRALLGLAKSNVGLAGFVMMTGILDIILGFGLILTGLVLVRK